MFTSWKLPSTASLACHCCHWVTYPASSANLMNPTTPALLQPDTGQQLHQRLSPCPHVCFLLCVRDTLHKFTNTHICVTLYMCTNLFVQLCDTENMPPQNLKNHYADYIRQMPHSWESPVNAVSRQLQRISSSLMQHSRQENTNHSASVQ
jgi:hypothetical protein